MPTPSPYLLADSRELLFRQVDVVPFSEVQQFDRVRQLLAFRVLCSESKGPPTAKGADPALPALVAVPSPEGKGPVPSPPPVDAVGAEPMAVPRDGVSASSRDIRDDLIGTARSLLDGLIFDDQCAVIGIHPQKATREVETAAGLGGRIIEIGAQPSKAVGVSYELQSEAISSDELCARAFQAEEHVAAQNRTNHRNG